MFLPCKTSAGCDDQLSFVPAESPTKHNQMKDINTTHQRQQRCNDCGTFVCNFVVMNNTNVSVEYQTLLQKLKNKILTKDYVMTPYWCLESTLM